MTATAAKAPHKRTAIDVLAGGFDRAAHLVALSRSERSRRRSSAESLGPIERATALRALAARYVAVVPLGAPELFFPEPPAPAVVSTRVRGLSGGGEVRDLSWPSGYVPFSADVADKWLSTDANRTAHARAFVHPDGRRPAVILLHGYLGGRQAVEERTWPLGWLRKKGFDAYLFVLPQHGARSGGGRPRFPASDPRLTIEGFRQAVHDLRSLVSLLAERGAPAVGVMGVSLGGYTSALLATVEPRLSFAVPFVPLASIADFAAEDGRFVGTASQRAEQHRLLEEVFAVVSPLARPALVPREGRLVVAARGDRITPPTHAERIAHHFEAPLVTFAGGHLLQFGRGEGFRAVGRMLGQLGLLPPRDRS